MKQRKPTITGFFPFLNDWGTIGSLVTTLDATLQKISSDYEILIIDDGSDIESKEILTDLKKKFSKLRIVTHLKNLGYGGAIKSGISHAQMDWIFYTDGDAQYDPRELTNLVAVKKETTDLVNGYKIKRNDPWYRIIMGRIYHYTVKILFNVPIRDTDCDFRLMRRAIFDKVTLEENSGLICAEMVKKISDSGFQFQEVPVHHFWRTSGKSQFFNFSRTIRMGFGLLRLWRSLVFQKYLDIINLQISYLPESVISRLGKIGVFLVYSLGAKLGLFKIIVMRSKEHIIAFACFLTTTNELVSLVVNKNSQNKGLGKYLVKQVIACASQNKIRQIKVKVLSTKPDINLFYKKLGFKFYRSKNLWGHEFNCYLSPKI